MRNFIRIVEEADSSQWWQEAIENNDWEDAFRWADSKEEIEKTLELCDAHPIKIRNQIVYVTDEHVIEWDGVSNSAELETKANWIYQVDLNKYFPDYEDVFNKTFWKSPYPLYHATTEENVDDIETKGLLIMDKTRGINNRGVGRAVFTTISLDQASEGHYGDFIFEIDTLKMKKNGYVPYVGQEPPIFESEYRSMLAREINYDEYYDDVESGIHEDTVIVYGNIPPEYLNLID